MASPKLYIVDGSVLPEVFIKVCRAKEYLETGEARTVADAVSLAGISRSAFYKYKDAVSPLRDMKRDQMVNLSVMTRDRPGALSSVLSIFAEVEANILTINQSIPVNGVGMVTISFIMEGKVQSVDMLRAGLESLPDVVRVEILSGSVR